MAKGKIKKQYLNGFERILKIDDMIAHMRYPSVADFARETEASVPTIHRDLRDLRLKFGADGILRYDRAEKGFYYASPSFRIPAMRVSEKQMVAASLMANLLKLIKGTPVYQKAIEVFSSLSENLEEDSALNAKKLSNRIVFLGMDPVTIDGVLWSKLEEAMAKNHYVSFDYLPSGRRFLVAPWQLIYRAGMWTLYSYSPKQKETRFFNLPCIRNLTIDPRAFELPEDFEYTKRAKGNFRCYIGKETYRFQLKITSEKTLNYIQTYRWAVDQTFQKQEDGSVLMTFTSNQDYPVLGWTLSHGMYVQPLEPEWLVREWKKHIAGMAKLCNSKIKPKEE